jgi:hypothetical protein
VDLEPKPSTTSCMNGLSRVLNHTAFRIVLYCAIALDMANVTLSVISEFLPAIHDRKNIFRSLNVVFVSFYIIEAVAKVRTLLLYG